MKPIKKLRTEFGRIPLKFTIWMYFIGFTIIVFVLLWLFQILFLEKFYTQSKLHDVEDSAFQIISAYKTEGTKGFTDTLTDVASENDLCIEVVDKFGRHL